jgi:hypothetical protein
VVVMCTPLQGSKDEGSCIYHASNCDAALFIALFIAACAGVKRVDPGVALVAEMVQWYIGLATLRMLRRSQVRVRVRNRWAKHTCPHQCLAACMLVACPGNTATCICVTSGFRQVARRGIGWLGLRLVLKSPLWLAPVVYLTPLKPIIIIIIAIVHWSFHCLNLHA